MPGLPELSFANLMAGMIFGSIGFVAFIYGKRMNVWRPMFLGLVLMVFPYFIGNTTWLFAMGIFGTALLFLFRN
jgi:hypothetical protein